MIPKISWYYDTTANNSLFRGNRDSHSRCYNRSCEKRFPKSIMKVKMMKISGYFLFLIFVSAMLGCQKETTTVITPPTATNAMNTEKSNSPETATTEFVIDVRTQKEWDTGHLKQAIRIPHTEIAERIGEVTENKSAKIVLY